jgi:hypothetical protein
MLTALRGHQSKNRGTRRSEALSAFAREYAPFRFARCVALTVTRGGISYDGNGSGSDFNTDVWGAFYAESPKIFSWVRPVLSRFAHT